VFRGIFIPEAIAKLPIKQLSYGAKVAYGRLARYAGKDGMAFPRRDTLAEEIGCSTGRLDELIKELKKFPLIETEQRGLKKSNLYFFLWNKEVFNESVADADTGLRNTASQESSDTSSQDSDNTNTPSIKESQNKKIKNKRYTASADSNNGDKLKLKVPFPILDLVVNYRQKINNAARLSRKAERLIEARAKEFTKKELLKSIDNFSRDNWFMENHSRNGMEWFFKDADQVLRWLYMGYSLNKKQKMQKVTRI